MLVCGRLVSLWMEMVRFYGLLWFSKLWNVQVLATQLKGEAFYFLPPAHMVGKKSVLLSNEGVLEEAMLSLSGRSFKQSKGVKSYLSDLSFGCIICVSVLTCQKKIKLYKWFASKILMVFSSLWALNSLLLLCIILNGVQWFEIGILKALLVCCFWVVRIRSNLYEAGSIVC